MIVILRHALSAFYYADRKCWVNGPALALDLGTIEAATEAAKEEDFGGMEIVASFDEPDCELVLPLRRNGTRSGKAAPARSQVLASTLPPDLAGASTPFPPGLDAPGLT